MVKITLLANGEGEGEMANGEGERRNEAFSSPEQPYTITMQWKSEKTCLHPYTGEGFKYNANIHVDGVSGGREIKDRAMQCLPHFLRIHGNYWGIPEESNIYTNQYRKRKSVYYH